MASSSSNWTTASTVWVIIIVVLFLLLLMFLASKMWYSKHQHVHTEACRMAPPATIVSASANPPQVEVAMSAAEPPMAYYGQSPYTSHYHTADDEGFMASFGGYNHQPQPTNPTHVNPALSNPAMPPHFQQYEPATV
jgi:hypothetical protein